MRPVRPSSALLGTKVLRRVYVATPEYPVFRTGNEKKESYEGGNATDVGKACRDDLTSGTVC